jgi:polo-like kinase 1
MELHRRRKTVTEPEARYFMHQICNSLDYLHRNHIVHRDLKLGNLLLNDELQVKLGDFGLAARIGKTGERKMSVVSPFFSKYFKILYNF